MSDAARRKVEDLHGKYSGRGGKDGAAVHTTEVLADLDEVRQALGDGEPHDKGRANRRRQEGVGTALHGQPDPRGVRRR